MPCIQCLYQCYILLYDFTQISKFTGFLMFNFQDLKIFLPKSFAIKKGLYLKIYFQINFQIYNTIKIFISYKGI